MERSASWKGKPFIPSMEMSSRGSVLRSPFYYCGIRPRSKAKCQMAEWIGNSTHWADQRISSWYSFISS